MLLASTINGSQLLMVFQSEWEPHKEFHSQTLREFRRKSSITQDRLPLRRRPSRESIKQRSLPIRRWERQQVDGFPASTTAILGSKTSSPNRRRTTSMTAHR